MIPEVGKDVEDRTIRIHRNAANRAIKKLTLHDVDANMVHVISDFWDKEKQFYKQRGMYSEKYRWNSPYVDTGNLAVWQPC